MKQWRERSKGLGEDIGRISSLQCTLKTIFTIQFSISSERAIEINKGSIIRVTADKTHKILMALIQTSLFNPTSYTLNNSSTRRSPIYLTYNNQTTNQKFNQTSSIINKLKAEG